MLTMNEAVEIVARVLEILILMLTLIIENCPVGSMRFTGLLAA